MPRNNTRVLNTTKHAITEWYQGNLLHNAMTYKPRMLIIMHAFNTKLYLENIDNAIGYNSRYMRNFVTELAKCREKR